MNTSTSTFKIALISIFAVCIVVGMIIFAMQKAGSAAQHATVTVWGTISPDTFETALKASSLSGSKLISVNYVQKNTSTFDADFVQALADGAGPDVVILRDDLVYKEKNRLLTIPYASYSERGFKDTFIQEGEMYLTPTGPIALPFMIDPLVMYWNRDLFSNNLLAQPPKYWEEFSDTTSSTGLISTITHRDSNANITQSALALGGWDNITNAKEILTMLLLQAGSPITQRNSQGSVVSALSANPDSMPLPPSTAAVNFYTQFANPTSPTYTWNASLPTSINFFLSGNLATYIGFASEIFSIREKNPNLNFDVTYVPQMKPAGTQTPKQAVFAHMYSLSIVKQSQNITPAFSVLGALTESASLTALSAATSLPPVRRDLVSVRPSNPYLVVFYNSALLSRGWIDPDGPATAKILRSMVQSIDSGSLRTSEAITAANDSLNLLFK